MEYCEPCMYSHEKIERTIAAGTNEEKHQMLLGIAYYEADLDYAFGIIRGYCLDFSNPALQGLAVQCMTYLAMFHSNFPVEEAKQIFHLIIDSKNSNKLEIIGRMSDVLDDLANFVPDIYSYIVATYPDYCKSIDLMIMRYEWRSDVKECRDRYELQDGSRKEAAKIIKLMKNILRTRDCDKNNFDYVLSVIKGYCFDQDVFLRILALKSLLFLIRICNSAPFEEIKQIFSMVIEKRIADSSDMIKCMHDVLGTLSVYEPKFYESIAAEYPEYFKKICLEA